MLFQLQVGMFFLNSPLSRPQLLVIFDEPGTDGFCTWGDRHVSGVLCIEIVGDGDVVVLFLVPTPRKTTALGVRLGHMECRIHD